MTSPSTSSTSVGTDPASDGSRVDLTIGPDEAWRFLTEADLLGEWLGHGSTIDPCVGGDGFIDDVETGQRRHVAVTEVEPGRTLGFDWWPVTDSGEPGDVSHVTIAIEPSTDGCTITVVEQPAASARASASAGTWEWRLAALELHTLLVRAVAAGR